MQAVLQAGFNEGELVVLSLEAVPGRRPQPGVSRGLVVSCDATTVTLSLQRRLRASLANPPAQVWSAVANIAVRPSALALGMTAFAVEPLVCPPASVQFVCLSVDRRPMIDRASGALPSGSHCRRMPGRRAGGAGREVAGGPR